MQAMTPPRRRTDAHLALAERVRAHIDANAEGPLPLAALARDAGVSPAHLQRTFTRVVGLSPRQYREQRRVAVLKNALRDGRTVSSATYDAGFGSGRRVYETAAETLGMTPGAYRRRGAGIAIHYTIVPVSLGRLLVALTERGICSVALGDDDAPLLEGLRAELPGAELVRAVDADDRLVDAVVAHVEGRAAELAELPLDVRATAFQWQVWRALQRIPEGATRSYQAVATELGRPTAARAVARACASNRIAVLIPCHRVVRGDGGLGGYRWGVARKAALLAREGGNAGSGGREAP
ncbi:MAG: methylated-DNA-[protein]-cysteine S-methyltransferase [Gemmatimonadetes bacterium]|jgi:AraC family transcriptional regulator of adaptative response/methylated-DNA-[protein]-cysteine methyltransferase|nr:methylated-DNA-[protein]-cysteine S-methyltransferase [Gemmatimonadota bacterium]